MMAHTLEAEAPRLAETIATMQAEIAKLKANPDYSKEFRDKHVAERESQLLAYLDGRQGELYAAAAAEFETIQAEHQAAKILGKDATRQKFAPMLSASEMELKGQRFRNLGELEAFYERSRKTDPALAYVIELVGENLALGIDPSNPRNGSWSKTLKRNLDQRAETDQTRALLGKLETLRVGATALNSVSHSFHRAANGVTTPHLGTWARQIQELEWSIAGYLSENAAPVMGDQETGRSGGVFMPSPMPAFVEG